MQYRIYYRMVRPKDLGLFPDRHTSIVSESLEDVMLFGHAIGNESPISIEDWKVVATGINGEVLLKAEKEDVYCVVQKDQIEQITY
jgi:precorrin isomerase